MKESSSKSYRPMALLIAVAAWASVIAQYFFKTGSAGNFFSFFTIQCNILVAITTTSMLLLPVAKGESFFNKLSVQTAIALYILIVALVYNTVLRGLIPLTGWNLFLDTMLHVINPALYLLYWGIVLRKNGQLNYREGLYWLVFPFFYLLYSLVRGAISGWYPYPFLNADEKGYTQVSINVAIMIVVFLASGLALIALSRSLRKAGTVKGS